MKMSDIRKIAKAKGVQPRRLTKAALVRAIQLNEGNFDCFGSATNRECDQLNCLWREDCLKPATTKAA
ncbi:MAG TPA: SAP domain-containing protein [Sedimenticola sp.]|nr:SAP domain-containing protein [Sedimenticola sp.]